MLSSNMSSNVRNVVFRFTDGFFFQAFKFSPIRVTLTRSCFMRNFYHNFCKCLHYWSKSLLALDLKSMIAKTRWSHRIFRTQSTMSTSLTKMIEVIYCNQSHKHLGKFMNATSIRSTFELQHRIKAAWQTFQKHRRRLLNRIIPTQVRLRLFSSSTFPVFCLLPQCSR